MHRFIIISAIALTALPAYAEIVITNSASVNSSASASASTGGNEADAGGRIETGDVSASASSEAVVTGEASVETRTETIIDGKSTVDEKRYIVPKGETVTVSASSSARSGGTRIEEGAIDEKESPMGSVPEEEQTLTRTEKEDAPAGVFARLSLYIERFVARFGLFAWWR